MATPKTMVGSGPANVPMSIHVRHVDTLEVAVLDQALRHWIELPRSGSAGARLDGSKILRVSITNCDECSALLMHSERIEMLVRSAITANKCELDLTACDGRLRADDGHAYLEMI